MALVTFIGGSSGWLVRKLDGSLRHRGGLAPAPTRPGLRRPSEGLLKDQLAARVCPGHSPTGGTVMPLGTGARVACENSRLMAGLAQRVAAPVEQGPADAPALVSRRNEQGPDRAVARVAAGEPRHAPVCIFPDPKTALSINQTASASVTRLGSVSRFSRTLLQISKIRGRSERVARRIIRAPRLAPTAR